MRTEEVASSRTDWLYNQPVAHRGYHHLTRSAPENTLAAFSAAAVEGFAIELDVQLSADGQVVVFHDDDLERTAGVKKPVDALRYADLASYPLMGTNERIPLLTTVLDTVAGRVPIMVEIKNFRIDVGELEQATSKVLRPYDGPLAIISFNPLALQWFAEHHPHLLRGQVSGSLRDSTVGADIKGMLRDLQFNSISQPDFVSYQLSELPRQAVTDWRKTGPVLAWTVRGEEDRRRASELADNIVFEEEPSGGGD